MLYPCSARKLGDTVYGLCCCQCLTGVLDPPTYTPLDALPAISLPATPSSALGCFCDAVHCAKQNHSACLAL